MVKEYKGYILNVDTSTPKNPLQYTYAPIIEDKQRFFWLFNTLTFGVIYNGYTFGLNDGDTKFSPDGSFGFTFEDSTLTFWELVNAS